MLNYFVAIFFAGISFVTGLSVAFNLCSLVADEKKFFKSKKNAILLYIISMAFAVVFMIVSYIVVCYIQKAG